MNDVNCRWLKAMVVESLQMLAAPSTTQIEYVLNGGFHHDELALELDGVVGAFLDNCQPSKAASLALGALNRQLDKMSGPHNARLWTDEALMSSEEWSTVRRWSAKSLTELREIPLSPSELSSRPRRFVPPTSRDAAAYGLVLRHTVEVGHGWGTQPSPLRGFYVLNRAIPDVEDPSFDQEVFENQGIGTPFSPALKQLLASSVADVAAIHFVPRFLELVDLKSSQPVWVRNSRGFVAMSPIRESERHVVVGVYFYAGGRWSRSNRYELIERHGNWGITKFQNLMIS